MRTRTPAPAGFDAAFERVRACEPGTVDRKAAAAAVVDALYRGRTLAVWGHAAHRQHDRRNPGHSGADAAQVMALTLLAALHRAPVERLTAIARPLGWLHEIALRGARGHAQSAAVTPYAGMAGAAARRRRYLIARSRLSEQLDREPSPAEIVAHANAQALVTRKNPRKQGVLLSLADARSPRGVDIHDPHEHVGTTDGGLEAAEHRAEIRIALGRAVAEIEHLEDDPERRAFALRALAAWAYIVAAGETPSGAAIQREIGGSYDAAKEAYATALEALATVRGEHATTDEAPARVATVTPIRPHADRRTEVLEAA